MSIKCKLGLHSWNGCKCTICGQTRDKQHDWLENCEKCTTCGKTRENNHDWSNDCEKCSKCGNKRSNQHIFEGCKCTVCGKENHNWQIQSDGCIRCGKIIEVATIVDLQSIKNDLTAHYLLVADIDATETINWNNGKGFEPIGNHDNPFNGKLIGNNHTIKNLFINRPKENYIGLFGSVEGGALQNIILVDLIVKGDYDVGGLVADNRGSISECILRGEVLGKSNIGGLIGSNNNNKFGIEKCSFEGKVTGVCKVGGLIGQNYYNKLSNVSMCSSAGTVTGEKEVGGLVGQNTDSYIKFCSSSCKVTGKDEVGSMVGKNSNSGISQCSSSGEVNGDDYVGGMAGMNDNNSSNSGCISSGKVVGKNYVGGLVGWNKESYIGNCNSTSKVLGKNYVGGLVGKNEHISTVTKCNTSNEVKGNECVGGLIGMNTGVSNVLECFSSSEVRGETSVGGIIGWHHYGGIKFSSFVGKIIGIKDVGGLIGTINELTEVSQCFSSGSVKGNENVGGMVGESYKGIVNNPDFKKSFWDIQTSGKDISAGGIGKTTNELKMKSTYEGWDFENIWQIDEGKSYPIHKFLQAVKENEVK